MFITFEKVRYKNFLSTGNQFTEIVINKSPKTLIYGTNGSGKTTFVDAVYFALFGKSYRKVKKDKIVNYINKKQLVVELEFSIQNNKYKIIRGIKPNIFEIYRNSELINEESTSIAYQKYLEKFILHMNEKLFTQTVILGSTNYIPFMILTAGDRRIVIEGLLDIQLFSVMNALAKIQNTDLSRRENNLKYELEKLEISINHLKQHIAKTVGNTKEFIDNIMKKHDALNVENVKLTSAVDELLEKSTELSVQRDKVGDLVNIRDIKNKLHTFATQFDQTIKTNLKRVQFYQDNDSCPTCSQEISVELKTEKVCTHEVEIDKNGINYRKAIDAIKEHDESLSEIQDYNNKILLVHQELSKNQNMVSHNNNTMSVYDTQVKDLSKKSDTTNEGAELLVNEKQKAEYQIKLTDIEASLLDYKAVLALLKDSGIKARIVNDYIPVINKLIKKYLEILEFPIIFQFDKEFNEFIKVRGRDDITYPNLSEGEKMRINLSLIFAFRELSVMRNATHCNLIIFDEIADSSLDTNGWDSFLRILKSVTDDNSQNVFIISHKGDSIIDKFDCLIKFEKRGGQFSEIIPNRE